MSERKSAVAHKIRRRNTILALFTIIILIGVCLFTPLFDITDVSVIGNKILSEEDIVKASGIKKGSNLFLLNIKKSEERINSLGYVDSVDVKRKFLARIEIEITESVEAAYITFAGNYVGIDSDGKILSITKSSKMRPKKAVVSGYALKNPRKGEKIEGKNEAKTQLVKNVLTALNENELLSVAKKIDLSDTSNISVTLNSDTKIVLGDKQQLDYKLKCVGTVLEELGEIRGGKINVSDPSNVIYEGGN